MMRDTRTNNVIGFLVAKKLLFASDVMPQATVKLNVEDVLWVGAHVEPRVIEVFPAALIHFPKTFLHQETLPEALREIVEKIRRNKKDGPDFNGITYQQMRHWALKPLADRRTKPVGEKKIMKSYRFSPDVSLKLKTESEKRGINETRLLEQLVESL